jgi:hypothetical protein
MTTTTVEDNIKLAFQYWGAIPKLAEYLSISELRRNYTGHWFDPETIRYFGSRNITMVRPGIVIEYQSKAPEGIDRYVITAFVVMEDGRISTYLIGRETSRVKAIKYAIDAYGYFQSL